MYFKLFAFSICELNYFFLDYFIFFSVLLQMIRFNFMLVFLGVLSILKIQFTVVTFQIYVLVLYMYNLVSKNVQRRQIIS